ncbi:MAG: hypothetical protein ABSE22_07555 [Xanthobacteraceae bacterium]|jgi:hypothetical protein
MIEALYWWDEAARFKAEALRFEDADRQAEYLELAATCEAVAIDVEDRATSG